ncbi:MAG TPA: tyrosine-type recombinase/integrase, partial [Solirubrobacterales bacterium]|nr:tyrosine-type recombinase/integrase [Solirubrobacterales bacterium]
HRPLRHRQDLQEGDPEAGLRPIKFHGLRHSFGTLAVQAFPLSDVQAWMGHRDIQTTMRYVHHVPKTDAAQRLGELLDGENVTPNLTPNPEGKRSPKGVEHA